MPRRNTSHQQRYVETESEKMEKNNRKEKWAGIAILTSDNTVFNLKSIKRDEEEYNIVVKGCIQQEVIMITLRICTRCQGTSLCETNSNKFKGRYRLQYNNSGRT